MRYISLFSGIEAASVALDGMGWEAVAFSEIDPFPSAVLAHRFPDVPNLGDITKVDWEEVVAEHGPVDVVVGGSPCQSFSIAGGRESLAGESALCFEYWRAVRDIRPRWFLWENVPGVFSTRDNAFGQFLGKMEELGYGMAWRTLDAQFFGVAQRRRRVFLVGCLGEGGAPAAVLFERESVSGNTQSSREKRQELARAVEERARSGGGGAYSLNREIIPENGTAQGPVEQHEVCPTLDTAAQPHGVAVTGGCLTSWDVQSKRIFDEDGVAPTLNSGDREGGGIQPSVLAFAQNTRDEVRIQGDGTISGALSASPGMKQTTYVAALQSDGSTSVNSHGDGFNDDGSAYTLNLIDRQSVVCIESGNSNAAANPSEELSPTLNCMSEQPIVIDRAAFNQGANAAYPPHVERTDVMDALVARGPHAVCTRSSEPFAPVTPRGPATSTSGMES